MSDMLKKLIEERANVWEQTKQSLDTIESEGREFTGEAAEDFKKRNARLDELDGRIKELDELAQRNKDAEEMRTKYAAAASAPAKDEAPSYIDQIRALGRGETRVGVEVLPESRDLTKGSATAGGNTVPTSFYNKLWEHMIEVSGILSAGPTVLRTDSGENFEVPVTTAHSTAALIAEAGTLTESDPAFAKRTLGAYKYGMSLQLSTELLEDTGVDLTGYIARQAGRAVGNALGTDLAVGNASSKPSGIVQTASTGVTGATSVAGAFTADNLIDLYYSVISPYRASSSAGWLMRDATVGAARKLKDSQNRYLWEPSLQVGAPDQLLGKPVYTDPNIAAVGLSAKSVVFGDISAYIVRLAGGIRFERSDEFAFQNDLVTFRCIVRGDGILADQTGAVKVFVGGAS